MDGDAAFDESQQAPIVVIGVNYHTDSLALRFAREVTGMAEGREVVLVMVDNTEMREASGFCGRVLTENPRALCVKPHENLGYFGGASFGLGEYLSAQQDYAWVIVSNVDIEFKDAAFFDYLSSLDTSSNVAVVAPSIWSTATRRDENPMMACRPSKQRMQLYKYLHRSYLLLNLYEVAAAASHAGRHLLKHGFWKPTRDRLPPAPQKGGLDSPSTGKSRAIYAPHGACMVFSKQFFAQGGSLGLPFFLFGEEIYVAETVRRMGLQIVYDPKLRLIHNEHRSTRRKGIFHSRQAAEYIRESTEYLVEHFFA